ncbi:MAG: universal stress protein [Elusimicrobiota bacterium]
MPFDLSEFSEAAWRQAVAFAGRFKCELEVLYVLARPSVELAALPPLEFSTETKQSLLTRIRATVGAAPKVSIVVGDPVRVILRQARLRRADLIVMGTHGRTGLKRALAGSVAEAVARRAPVPVLAVRGKDSSIGSILSPVNFTDYSYFGFTYAAALAAGLGARLTALHVHVDPIWNGNPQHKFAKLQESLPSELRATFRTLVETGENEATQGILNAGARHDLIVLVAHEKSSVKAKLLGTTAERVLRHALTSVLVVPALRRSLPTRMSLPTPCCATA